MTSRPITTLFMLMSVDGKISTGISNDRDFDKDLPDIKQLANGLKQYYALEEQTDLFSLNTGRVMAKVGWNKPKRSITKIPVSFVIIDNEPHLTQLGVLNLLERTDKLYIATTNKDHPAFSTKSSSLSILLCDKFIDFENLFIRLKNEGVKDLTIQSGGTLNSVLLRLGLIDNLSVVMAPVLVGGLNTPTLIDGTDIERVEDIAKIRPLSLSKVSKLNDSYLHLVYEVINS